jgi:hypothetical protein
MAWTPRGLCTTAFYQILKAICVDLAVLSIQHIAIIHRLDNLHCRVMNSERTTQSEDIRLQRVPYLRRRLFVP